MKNKMIYFDHASTSYPKPKEVLEETDYYLQNIGVNPGRGTYSIQGKAGRYIDEVRKKIAHIFHIQNAHHISFTCNATHSLNIILKGFLKQNDHVLACSFSHNSVIRPLHQLQETSGITYDYFTVDENGNIDLTSFEKLIKPTTKLVVFNHASNVLGVRSHFEQVLPLLKKRGIAVLVDVTQTAGIIPLNIQKTDIDFLAGSGHKTFCGPSGIGFLYIKNPDLVDHLQEGGNPANASSSPYHPMTMPGKFEFGTMNYMGIAGLNGSLASLEKITFNHVVKKSMTLTEYAWKQLQTLPKITLFGTSDMTKKVPIISFTIDGLLPQLIAQIMDTKHSIAVRAGLHCAPIIHQQIGTFPTGTVRMSLSHTNTQEQIDCFIQALTIHTGN